jgi:dipeptidase D
LYIGCAGGTNANVKFTYTEVPADKDVTAYKLSVTGLKGGHSGVDIHLGRGNSNKVLFRFLWHAAKKHGMRLSSVDGGSLRNAIPRESFAIITIPNSMKADFLKCVPEFTETFRKELSAVEPDLKMDVVPVDLPKGMMDEKTQRNLIGAIYGCPNGVMRMSNEMAGLVETSTNLAIVKSENGTIRVHCLLRSSVDSAKMDLEHMMQNIFELAGAEIIFDGQYPGWKPNPASPILKAMQDIYKKKYGNVPEIKAIHAGLECGLLGGVYPNWDMISFGPTIRYPHSPDEKVNIATVQKFWDFLVETLKEVPVK